MKFNTVVRSPYTAKEIYSIIIDVEKYPEFLLGCQNAVIHSRDDNEMAATLIVGYKGVTEEYTSRVEMKEPDEKNAGTVEVSLLKHGPLQSLHNKWCVEEDLEGNGCIITFDIDFSFSSSLLNAMASGMFEYSCNKLIKSFEKRADQLFMKKAKLHKIEKKEEKNNE